MTKGGARKPTSFDVARLAGVSRSAVSRAYTPGAAIAPETRERVKDAAATLGYRVNSLARGLQQDHSNIVGLVASRLDTPLRSHQVRTLSECLIRQGFKPMLIAADHAADIEQLADGLLGYNIAGMIFTSDTPPRTLIEECEQLGLPVVLINRADVTDWADRVLTDNTDAGGLAFRLLTQVGAKHLGCLMPGRETYSVCGRARAFVAAAARNGIEATVILSENQTYAGARRTIEHLDKAQLRSIDGLFCATDLMAIGALDGIRLVHGMSVPEDIQVLGFDDIEQAGWAAYDLSTIHQDVDAQSDTAIRLLTERIRNRSLPKRVIRLGLSSVMRGTTRND